MKIPSVKMKLSIPLVVLTVLPLVAQASAGVFPRQGNRGGDNAGDAGGGDNGGDAGDANNGADGGADGGANNSTGTDGGGNNDGDPQTSLSTMVCFSVSWNLFAFFSTRSWRYCSRFRK